MTSAVIPFEGMDIGKAPVEISLIVVITYTNRLRDAR